MPTPTPLEKVFGDLCRELESFRAALEAIERAAAGDARIVGGCAELLPVLAEALRAAQRGGQASARRPADIDNMRRALPCCQRQFSRVMREFRAGMNAPEGVEELRLAGSHALVWAIGRANGPLFAADWALGACWRALGEYAALRPGGALPFFIPR